MDEQLLKRLDEVALQAIDRLGEFFTSRSTVKEDVNAARVAASALSACTRAHQVMSAQRTNDLILARSLAINPDQLQAFIAVTAPNHPAVIEHKRLKEEERAKHALTEGEQ